MGLVNRFEGNQLYLDDGQTLDNIDTVILCTGYEYDFPFLDLADIGVTNTGKNLFPLYMDLFCVDIPTLAFIGLPTQILPFLLSQYQCRYVAQVLAGISQLPDKTTMLARQDKIEPEFPGYPLRYRKRQIDYIRDLAVLTGTPDMPEELWQQLEHAFNHRRENQGVYRDIPLQEIATE